MPDDPALAFADALLGRLHTGELMLARHLFDAVVENDEVADQIEQPGFLTHLGERTIQQSPRR